MLPLYWFLIGIIILILGAFVRSYFFLLLSLGALFVAFISLKVPDINIYLQVFIFLAVIFIWNFILQFPRKWLKILALKTGFYDINHQLVRTIKELKEQEVGKVKWSGVVVNAKLAPNNIDRVILKDYPLKVVKLEGFTFIVTSNNF